jgi:hypothetical protein
VTTAPVRPMLPLTANTTPETRARWWRAEILLVGLIVGGLTILLPLYDPDLPMHLAIGEWIVQHRALPLVEPFAWTRVGAPYYAYSWLPETTFYLVHRAFGPVGLRVLQGLLMVGVAAATASRGRAARWHLGTMICVPALSVLVAALVTPSLRPQIVLLIVLPLVWAEMYRLQAGAALRPIVVRLVFLSAVAANSHLFFVLVLAPVSLLLTRRPLPLRLVVVVGASLASGWLLTPYVLHWPELLRTSFAPNAIMAWPSPVAELQPGFRSLLELRVIALPALVLTLLPWSRGISARPPAERLMAGAYWLVGLVGFAYAVRLLLVWWLLVLPFVAWAIEARAAREADSLPRLHVRLPAYVALLVLLVLSVQRSSRSWASEGTTETRTLATTTALGAEPLARWLAEHARPRTRGRLYTVFNYGSYLTWRLPGMSASIDSRGIFPDSVAAPETLIPADREPIAIGPWASADVAIVPLNRRVAAVLDTAAGWRRVATALPDTGSADASGLWVRERWWQEAGSVPLPSAPVRLRIRSRY